jgi:hypothetical protein
MGNRQWGGGERGGGEFNAEGAKITQRCGEEREKREVGRGRPPPPHFVRHLPRRPGGGEKRGDYRLRRVRRGVAKMRRAVVAGVGMTVMVISWAAREETDWLYSRAADEVKLRVVKE